jgi:hypothetical protein
MFSDFDVKLIPNYGALFVVISAAIGLLSIAASDPKSLTTSAYIYMLSIAIPLIAVFVYIVPVFVSNTGNNESNLGIAMVITVVTLAAAYFYTKMNRTYAGLIGYMGLGVIILIIFVGLALLFLLLSNYLKSFTGITGFILNLIFYIPCLIIDYFKYLVKEFKTTSNLIYALFLLEILLIIIYIYIPKLVDLIDKQNGIVLLAKGAYLDESMAIGSSNILKIPKNELENDSEENVYRETYAISMWININIKAHNTSAYSKETSIFDFGGGKPKITYYNNINDGNKHNKFVVYFTNDTKKGETAVEIEMPIQKWNNLVFNYTSEKADLFVNGELIRTYAFNKNRPKINGSDPITIGSENGLDGAICNVRFYTKLLTSTEITSSYNLLMYRNPPVFIL